MDVSLLRVFEKLKAGSRYLNLCCLNLDMMKVGIWFVGDTGNWLNVGFDFSLPGLLKFNFLGDIIIVIIFIVVIIGIIIIGDDDD